MLSDKLAKGEVIYPAVGVGQCAVDRISPIETAIR